MSDLRNEDDLNDKQCMHSGESEEISCPPEGLTTREQARWWLRNPQVFQTALSKGVFAQEFMLTIEQVAKDNDLAYKVIDSKQVKGLTNIDRSRLFSLLTDGGEWEGKDKSRPPETVRDLNLALQIQGIDSVRERNKILRAVTNKYAKAENNIGRLQKHLDGLMARFTDVNLADLRNVLKHATDENFKMSEDEIHFQLDLMTKFREEENCFT